MSPEKKAEKTESVATVVKEGDHDRIVMASRKPDGSPDQTENFEYIGDKDVAIEAAETQLAEQAVSAVDAARRGVSTDEPGIDGKPGGNEGSSAPDPVVQDLKDDHEKAAAAAKKTAKAEVEAHHKGLGDD